MTGAAGNFGGHIVERFLREGATVVMTGRDPDRLEAARTRVLQAAGAAESQAAALRMDGADPEQVRAAIAAAIDGSAGSTWWSTMPARPGRGAGWTTSR